MASQFPRFSFQKKVSYKLTLNLNFARISLVKLQNEILEANTKSNLGENMSLLFLADMKNEEKLHYDWKKVQSGMRTLSLQATNF